MINRAAHPLVVLGIALGCSGNVLQDGVDGHVGGTGPAVGSWGSEGGRVPNDQPSAGAGGEREVGGQAGEGGSRGSAPVEFWTEATQHLEIECFGFFAGFATFRADRGQLSAEQLDLLERQTGLPGSTYDDNDDGVHCLVTTTDARARQRQFTIDYNSDLITSEMVFGEGGAPGNLGEVRNSVLGCELQSPYPGQGRPFSANPFCLREVWPSGVFELDLATPNQPYHVELVHCTKDSLGSTTVELFGADSDVPLAVGVTPEEPGPDQACLVLDARVGAKVTGKLVINASPDARFHLMTFR